MALAAALGGAKAIRANTPLDIAAIHKAVDLPIIGLWKVDFPDFPVYITPTIEQAKAVADAGAQIIAIDATNRPRPQPGTLADFIRLIHQETGKLVLADVATHEEGVAAEAAGGHGLNHNEWLYRNFSQLPDPDGLSALLASAEGAALCRRALPHAAPGEPGACIGCHSSDRRCHRAMEITKWFLAETRRKCLAGRKVHKEFLIPLRDQRNVDAYQSIQTHRCQPSKGFLARQPLFLDETTGTTTTSEVINLYYRP